MVFIDWGWVVARWKKLTQTNFDLYRSYVSWRLDSFHYVEQLWFIIHLQPKYELIIFHACYVLVEIVCFNYLHTRIARVKIDHILKSLIVRRCFWRRQLARRKSRSKTRSPFRLFNVSPNWLSKKLLWATTREGWLSLVRRGSCIKSMSAEKFKKSPLWQFTLTAFIPIKLT
jgi:hypothetical protein